MIKAMDLTVFCADYSTNIAIQRPFSRGNYTWATDGKILVRVPRLEDVPEVKSAPHVERVWPSTVCAYMKVDPILISPPESILCDVCYGRGVEHDCPDCTCTCDECDGRGRVEALSAVKIGSQEVNTRYARLIMALPDLHIGIPTEEPIQFKFEGGEGLLMPLRPGFDRPVVAVLLEGAQ